MIGSNAVIVQWGFLPFSHMWLFRRKVHQIYISFQIIRALWMLWELYLLLIWVDEIWYILTGTTWSLDMSSVTSWKFSKVNRVKIRRFHFSLCDDHLGCSIIYSQKISLVSTSNYFPDLIQGLFSAVHCRKFSTVWDYLSKSYLLLFLFALHDKFIPVVLFSSSPWQMMNISLLFMRLGRQEWSLFVSECICIPYSVYQWKKLHNHTWQWSAHCSAVQQV